MTSLLPAADGKTAERPRLGNARAPDRLRARRSKTYLQERWDRFPIKGRPSATDPRLATTSRYLKTRPEHLRSAIAANPVYGQIEN